MVDNRVQISGLVALMEVNGLFARFIVQKNPGHEFFVEESFVLDWMYPYLSPHGLIFKLNATPLAGLSAETVQQDHEFWRKLTGEFIGDWLTDNTSVQEVCDFVEKIYREKNLKGFKGNTGFALNPEAQITFSYERSSIGGMYAWRAEHAKDEDERKRMSRAADLAFRQAFALCPYSPNAVLRYSRLLISLKRTDDALLIAKTCLRVNPEISGVPELVKHLQKSK